MVNILHKAKEYYRWAQLTPSDAQLKATLHIERERVKTLKTELYEAKRWSATKQ